ncbi:MAG TPA: glycine cleavage T C-terminal barrel domain-containing protein [Polyangiaceae bacterium]
MDPKAQVQAAKERALAVQHADLAVLAVTGKDRITWLNGLLTCDLAKRAPGSAVYGLVVERKGHVMSDVVAVLDEPGERVLLVVPLFTVESLRAHLEHYLVMEDAEVALGDGWEVWSVHGPRAGAALEAARAAGGVGGAIDRTGLGGAEVLAPPDTTREVAAALAGEAIVGDDSGWEALRLERGVPRYGVDFDDKSYPQEAQLEKVAVSFDKGCYLGQEVVCMLEMRGHVKRKLVPVVLDAGAPPPRGAPVTDEAGAPVGEVTSAGTSPTLGKPVAMAMVKRAFAEAGKRLVVAGASGEVVERPA